MLVLEISPYDSLLDMLGITVYLDGENVEITGTIDTSIVLMPSSKSLPLSNRLTFCFILFCGFERGSPRRFSLKGIKGVSIDEVSLGDEKTKTEL